MLPEASHLARTNGTREANLFHAGVNLFYCERENREIIFVLSRSCF